MLFFLFPNDELATVSERLGNEFSPDTVRKYIDYYDRRTSHGSTLSLVAYAGALAQVDSELSWRRFLVALDGDVGDIQGGTTKEGIHMGVMGGKLDLVQRAFLGTEIRDGVLSFSPRLWDRLDGLSFRMQFRGVSLRLSLHGTKLTVVALPGGVDVPVSVAAGGQVEALLPAERCSLPVIGASSGDEAREEDQDVRGL